MSVFERLTYRRVDHVIPIRRASATGLVEQVYAQAEREFALAPPLTVHSAAPDMLAAVWAALRETLIAGPGRLEKEAVASAVSLANDCPFCVDVHSVTVDGDATQRAIEARDADAIADPSTAAAVRFAFASGQAGEAAVLVGALPANLRVALAGTAVTFHFINRVVNVFMREQSPLPAAGWLRGPLRAFAARTVGRTLTAVTAQPGESLPLLKVISPSGFRWADESPSVGAALGALVRVGREGLHGRVQPATALRLAEALDGWRGEAPALGRRWLDDALNDVASDDLASARLALLAARAPYLVSEVDIAAVRARHGTDEAVVQLVAAGAAAAAGRVASWIGGGS